MLLRIEEGRWSTGMARNGVEVVEVDQQNDISKKSDGVEERNSEYLRTHGMQRLVLMEWGKGNKYDMVATVPSGIVLLRNV